MHYFAAQGVNLFDKLWSEVIKRDVGQVLQLTLIGQGADHGAAVALLEEALEQTADSIFLVNRLAKTFLVLERFFQVVF